YKSLPPDEDVLTIGLNRAVDLLAEDAKQSGGGARGLLRALGGHPADKPPGTLNRGRVRPYVKHGKVMASVARKLSGAALTLDPAAELLSAKAASRGGKGKGKKAGTAKATAKKKTAAASPARRKSGTA